MLSDDEITELLTITLPRLHRRLGPGASGAFDVEDLVQDALERALALRHAGREIDSLPAWVQTVVLNLRRDEWRSLQAEARAIERLAVDPTRPRAADPDGALYDELGALPPRQRQVVALHYYADLSVTTIAQRLDIDVGTVKSTLHRGRRALAALLRPSPRPESIRSTEVAMAQDIPGWFIAGSHPHQYELGLVDHEVHDGHRVGFLRCLAERPDGFATLMQIVDARQYRSSRLRFSGHTRTRDATWAGLWTRIDEIDGGFSAFDNMQHRPIQGTTEWERHHVVLDVGDESTAVAFGVLLGGGEVRFSDFALDQVGTEVPTTERLREARWRNDAARSGGDEAIRVAVS